MNEKDATNEIKAIENKFSEKIEIDGKNFWPLFRALLYLKITSSKKTKKEKKYDQSIVESFKNTIRNFKNGPLQAKFLKYYTNKLTNLN